MYYCRYFHDRLKTCQWSSLVSRENLIDTSVSHLKFKNSKYLKSWVLLRYFPSHLQYFNKYDKNRQCPYCLQHMVITVWLAHTPYQILYQLPMSWKKNQCIYSKYFSLMSLPVYCGSSYYKSFNFDFVFFFSPIFTCNCILICIHC